MSAYSGEFWHVRQNIYFNFLAQNVWEASKNKVPFWLIMPYSYADNWQEHDFDRNDNKQETTKIIFYQEENIRGKSIFFCIFMFSIFIMFDSCE